MKLSQVTETAIPIVFDNKEVNSLSKKPKKLKKGFYGLGGAAVVGHSAGCPAGNTGSGAGACTCGAGAAGGTGGAAAGGGAGGAGGAGGGGAGGGT